MKTQFNFSIKYFLLLLISVFSLSCSSDDNLYSFSVLDPDLSIDKTDFQVSKNKGELNLVVTSNLPWRIESKSSWITTSVNQGDKGQTNIAISYARNYALEPRSAQVKVWITEKAVQTVSIKQEKASIEDTYNNYYVSENGQSDGSSWQNTTSLSKALELAKNNNDIIHLQQGTYYPSDNAQIDTGLEKDRTFLINANIKLIGGYPKDATTGSKPSAEYKSVLSGNNISVHTVTVLAQKINGLQVHLENLQITQGNGDAQSSKVTIGSRQLPRDHGAGMIVIGSNLNVVNSEIINNTSGRHAAGMFIDNNSRVNIHNSLISNNTGVNTNSNAGGIFVNASELNVFDSEISNNTAAGVSGGLQSLNKSTVNLTSVKVFNNSSRANAGGFYHRGSSKSTIVNSYFYNNSVTSGDGGAISTHDNAILTIISSTLYNNTSPKSYACINNQSNNTVNLYNTLLHNNTSSVENNGINPAGQTNISSVAIQGKLYNYQGELVQNYSQQELTNTHPLKPSFSNSVIQTSGYSTDELMQLRNTLNLDVSIQEITQDLDNKTRKDFRGIGAYLY
ncbi:BACON domain-containing protein [Myroides pelagicus]